MDPSVSPGASFYRYANGRWLAATEIPADRASYGLFLMLRERSSARTREIIEQASGPPGSDGRRIADYYRTLMDEAAIEAAGLAPLRPWLDRIAAVTDVGGLIDQFAAASRRMADSPFGMTIDQDERAPERYIAYIKQGGLGLGDRELYDAENHQFDAARAGYQKYIAAMFALLGAAPADADRRAAAVCALEAKLAQAHWAMARRRDPQQAYNRRTIAALEQLAPGVPWKRWLAAMGLTGQRDVVIREPSAIAGTSRLIKSEPLAVWKDYAIAQLVTEQAPHLPRAFVDAHFEMFGRILAGTPQLAARWKRAVAEITGVGLMAGAMGGLGDAVGQRYVARFFPPDTKAHADALVKNLLSAMGQRLDRLTWMSAETRARAKAKLATYNPKIGYPKKWRDYASLTIVPGDAIGNAVRTGELEYKRMLAQLGAPIDRDEWLMTPMTVNAYYNPKLNEIVFPAAMFQPPYFDPSADDAVNYAGIGAVIGHEISHGFDDQGSQYDATGALANWWTPADADKFKAASARLVAQYDAYCPIAATDGRPALCVHGDLTLGENIADLAGITIAYDAYRLSLGGAPAPTIDGFTGDQRFFLGWAQIWRWLYREPELANLLASNPHSPAEFRASTVRNHDAWYDAFKAKPGDALYLAPDQRVRIW